MGEDSRRTLWLPHGQWNDSHTAALRDRLVITSPDLGFSFCKMGVLSPAPPFCSRSSSSVHTWMVALGQDSVPSVDLGLCGSGLCQRGLGWGAGCGPGPGWAGLPDRLESRDN